MVFTVGQEPQVFKAKNGQLTVVRPTRAPGTCDLCFLLCSAPGESSAEFQQGPCVSSEDLAPPAEQR